MKNHNMSIFPSPPLLSLSCRSSQFIASQRSSESVSFFVLSILFIFLCAALSCSSAGDLSSAWSDILTFYMVSRETLFFLLFMLTTLSAEWLDCFLGSVHRYGQEFRPDLAFACQLKWRKAKCNRLSPCKRVQGENNASGDFAADLGGRRSTIGFVSTFLCLHALW